MTNTEFMTSSEIASVFNVGSARVSQLKKTPGFPRGLAGKPGWYRRSDVLGWGKATGRISQEPHRPVMLQSASGKAEYRGATERFGHMVHIWTDGPTIISFAFNLGGASSDRRLIADSDTVVIVGTSLNTDDDPFLDVFDKGGEGSYEISWEQAATRIGQAVPYWEKMSSPELNRFVHLAYSPGGRGSIEIHDPGVRWPSPLWQMALSPDSEASEFAKWMLEKSAGKSANRKPIQIESPFAQTVTRWECSGATESATISREEAAHALRLFSGRDDAVSVAVAAELIDRPYEFGLSPFSRHTIGSESKAAAWQIVSGTVEISPNSVTMALAMHSSVAAPLLIRADPLSGSIYLFTDEGVEIVTSSGGWTDTTVTELVFHDRGDVIAVRADGSCFYAGYMPISHRTGYQAAANIAKDAADGNFNPDRVYSSVPADEKVSAVSARMQVHPKGEAFVLKLDTFR